MKLKKTLMFLGVAALASTLAVSCGETPPTSSTGGGTIVTPSDDPIFDTSDIVNDILIEDGVPMFDEEVTIKLWSIITQPDVNIFEPLVKEFNNIYAGAIYIDLKSIGHYDYYKTLNDTWRNERDAAPDMTLMHNEKTIEYAKKGYLYPLNDIVGEATGVDFDFTQAYENIDRVNHYQDHRFAIPLDAHGFLTSFRQDIIKKNNLGWDDDKDGVQERFIPQSRAEYQSLLENSRALADAGNLWVRNINKLDYESNSSATHAWYKIDGSLFYPSFMQSTDPDGLSALYANGGTLTNEDQTEVTFQNNLGFQTYITDQVDRYNNKLMYQGDTTIGGNVEMFANGNTLMFPEGPWWVGQTYTSQYNSPEMGQTEVVRNGKTYSTGITPEDAADPIYSKPYTAAHPQGWWTLEENMNTETGNKWYGNGHSISLTRNIKSMTKAAAALTFVKWLTQEMDEDDDTTYNLTNWCVSGHVPAWKNVYNSETYKAVASKSVVLTALGDPADIMAMEGLVYETTIFDGLASAVASVQGQLQTTEGCDKSKALQILQEVAFSTQAALELMM